jgi:hypothetical protein
LALPEFMIEIELEAHKANWCFRFFNGKNIKDGVSVSSFLFLG